MATRVLVIGGGVSGLTTAWQAARRGLDVTLVEAQPHFGNFVRSVAVPMRDLDPEFSFASAAAADQRAVIELGPDSLLSTRPGFLPMLDELDLSDRIIRTDPQRQGAFIVHRGAFVRIPEGFQILGPGEMLPTLRSNLLSARGKLRLALEPWIPAAEVSGSANGHEESLASFVRRRFGQEVLENLAQPIAAGIYGADAETLSLTATLARFAELEATFGSVSRGLWHARRPAHSKQDAGARYSLFVAFAGGMSDFIAALVSAARKAGARLESNWELQEVRRVDEGFAAYASDGKTLQRAFDCVVLANRTSTPLTGSFPEVHARLQSIPLASMATATFLFRAGDIQHRLDSYGFVVPSKSDCRLLAGTFSSQKWPGRIPRSHHLIRLFFRAADAHLDDASLRNLGLSEMRRLLGRIGTPTWSHIGRYPNAMPQYALGHLGLRQGVAASARAQKLYLAGNALFGVGIPDTCARGHAVVDEIMRDFPSR